MYFMYNICLNCYSILNMYVYTMINNYIYLLILSNSLSKNNTFVTGKETYLGLVYFKCPKFLIPSDIDKLGGSS